MTSGLKEIVQLSPLNTIKIPPSVRKRLRIKTRDYLSMKVEGSRIILTPYRMLKNRGDMLQRICSICSDKIGLPCIITDRNRVLAANGFGEEEDIVWQRRHTTEIIKDVIKAGMPAILRLDHFDKELIWRGVEEAIIIPIRDNFKRVSGVFIVVSQRKERFLTEIHLTVAELVADLIGVLVSEYDPEVYEKETEEEVIVTEE